jgi:hypothetical protein
MGSDMGDFADPPRRLIIIDGNRWAGEDLAG